MIIVEIAGHLGGDPEVRFTSKEGKKVTNFSVATKVRRSGKDETVWWRVVIWGDRFDGVMPYLKKGSAIIVVGEMTPPKIYSDKENRPQVSLEIEAQIIKLSPFGRQDRTGSEQPSMPQATAMGSAPSASADSAFASKATYSSGTLSGQALNGDEDFSGDEPLPF
jgi:single-strand DNA-binding protein